MTIRASLVMLVLLCVVPPALGGDCRSGCKEAAAACAQRAARDVADCRATVRERCGNACACEGLEGATLVACQQRCEVCRDMQREGAGLDCAALEQDRRAECERERAACLRRCDGS